MSRMMQMTIVGLLLSACATAPKATQFDNSRQVSLSFDDAWERTISYFAENNISIKTLEKDSGLIVAESATVGPDQLQKLADCGSAGVGQPGTASYNVFVRDQQSQGVAVQINAAFNQSFRNIWTGRNEQVQCLSKGVLEAALLAGY
jgi:hypothetical protein